MNAKFNYRNPIINRQLADPMILRDRDTYYLFASGESDDGRFIPIYKSRDLIQWTFVRGAVQKGPTENSWNRRNFWAPEVFKIGDMFHLYYSAMPEHAPERIGNRVGLAIAKNPEGPYEDVGVVIDHPAIDGHLYIHTDGKMVFYYSIKADHHDGILAGHLCGIEMASPEKTTGKPIKLITDHPWQEGPVMLFRDNIFFLAYSTGSWKNETYHVRYAIGQSPLGPFTPQPNILLQSTATVKGPGHHNLFIGPDGNDWMIYHGWDPAFTNRYPRIDPLLRNGPLLTTPGPTG